MNQHPYLRAYLAGVFVTTLILPLMLTAFIVVRLVFRLPVPIERGLIFPMALVPAVWGLWNVLWLASHARTHLNLGVHGALLPFLLLPCGSDRRPLPRRAPAGRNLRDLVPGLFHCLYALIAAGFCFGVAAYYLVWKYVIGFLNRELGID